MVVQFSEYSKNHWIVQFKCMNCMVCELYLNKFVIKNLKLYKFIKAQKQQQ